MAIRLYIMEDSNNEIQKMIAAAESFGREGDLESSIQHFSAALDILVARAKTYVRKYETVADCGTSKCYLSRFNKYLKRDKTACAISNVMALIYLRMGNNDSARIFLSRQST